MRARTGPQRTAAICHKVTALVPTALDHPLTQLGGYSKVLKHRLADLDVGTFV